MAKASASNGTVTRTTGATVADLCKALEGQFAERSGAIRALGRAFLAGEHAFLLGEPGTGKSLLVRTFAQALGLSYWEHLMTRFSTPEELFGPLSITQLQKDRYTRAMDGYLPRAEVAFLDECWKANGGILNALLTITNERVFHDDGKPVSCPLVSLVGASNELPESESELGALYDRFLVRLVTNYVSDRGAFETMLFGASPAVPTLAIDLRAEQKAARAVEIPDDVRVAIVDLRYKARDAGYKVSDRRWRQCVALVRASAHLEGRTVASVDDLECLEDVLWRAPEERVAVAKLIQEISNPDGAKAVQALDEAREIFGRLPAIKADCSAAERTQALGAVSQAVTDIKALTNRVEGLSKGRKVNEAVAEIARIRKETSKAAARLSGLEV